MDIPAGERWKGIEMRQLTYDEIAQITKGAAYTEVTEGKVSFHRFTKEQEDVYFRLRDQFYIAAQYSAGIKLEFQTDSKRLYLKADVWTGSANRLFFSFDVFFSLLTSFLLHCMQSTREKEEKTDKNIKLKLKRWDKSSSSRGLVLDEGLFDAKAGGFREKRTVLSGRHGTV